MAGPTKTTPKAVTKTETATEIPDHHIRRRKLDIAGIAFQLALIASLLACFAFLMILIVDMVKDGAPVFAERGTSFLTSDLSRDPAQTGVWQGIKGSLVLGIVTLVVAIPLGVACAVYLEEYAPDNRFTRFINLNIRNLAGVPSVVYGILGLIIFVQWFEGFTGGRSVIAGGLTLSVLVLPIVVITSAEAIRAVPQSLREGGFGVGATRWDVTRRLVLPDASPGILTGLILSLSRAIGETAPLLLVGAVASNFFTSGNAGYLEQLQGTYTALPVTVLTWARQPQAEFRELTSAAIVVLLGITLLANLAAILLRNRYQKKR